MAPPTFGMYTYLFERAFNYLDYRYNVWHVYNKWSIRARTKVVRMYLYSIKVRSVRIFLCLVVLSHLLILSIFARIINRRRDNLTIDTVLIIGLPVHMNHYM